MVLPRFTMREDRLKSLGPSLSFATLESQRCLEPSMVFVVQPPLPPGEPLLSVRCLNCQACRWMPRRGPSVACLPSRQRRPHGVRPSILGFHVGEEPVLGGLEVHHSLEIHLKNDARLACTWSP